MSYLYFPAIFIPCVFATGLLIFWFFTTNTNQKRIAMPLCLFFSGMSFGLIGWQFLHLHDFSCAEPISVTREKISFPDYVCGKRITEWRRDATSDDIFIRVVKDHHRSYFGIYPSEKDCLTVKVYQPVILPEDQEP